MFLDDIVPMNSTADKNCTKLIWATFQNGFLWADAPHPTVKQQCVTAWVGGTIVEDACALGGWQPTTVAAYSGSPPQWQVRTVRPEANGSR